MRDLRRNFVLAGVLLFVIASGPPILADDGASDVAYARAMGALWEKRFASNDVSYLLLSLRGGGIIAQRWQAPDRPVPVGSLVKPFTALAYAETHAFRFPRRICGAGSCWLPAGHGELDIVRAVAFSCNSYFASIGADVSTSDVSAVARRYGLRGPEPSFGAEELTGLRGAWMESPSAMAHAYAELLAQRAQPGVRDIVQGMAESARKGTASGLFAGAPRMHLLAKTGTTRCTHAHAAPGDGFVVAAWPADAPVYLLLLRLHGKPGAQAALLAGRMLGALGETAQ